MVDFNIKKQPSYFYSFGKKGNNLWWVWIASFFIFLFAVSYLPDRLNRIISYLPTNVGRDILLGYNKVGAINEVIFQAFLYIPYLIFLAFSLWFCQTKIRQRPLKDIITSAAKFRWGVLWKAVIIYLFVLCGAWFIKGLFAKPGDITWVFDKNMLIVWPIIIVCLPLYVLVQEMLYRAFIVQGLSLWVKNSFIVFIISSALYALSFTYAYDIIFGWEAYLGEFFIYGIFACIITSMFGGIEASVGIGIINGLVYSLFVSPHVEYFDQAFSLYSTGMPRYNAVTFFIELATLAITAILLSYSLPNKKT